MRQAWSGGIPKELLRVGLIFIVIIMVLLGTYTMLDDEQHRVIFMDVVSPAVEMLAAGYLFVVAYFLRRRSNDLFIAWMAIGLAVLLYGIGDTIWWYTELVAEQPPFPSPADAFYLLYYVAFLIGALRLIRKPIAWQGQLNLALELVTILVAGILAYWNLLIAPTIQYSTGQSVLVQLILLAYPVGDLMLFCTLVLIFYYQSWEEDITSTVVLTTGIAIMIFVDIIYSQQTLAGKYFSGTVLDFGWLSGNLLVGLAGLPQLRYALAEASPDDEAQKVFAGRLGAIRNYLPYAALLTVFVLLLRGRADPQAMSSSTVALGLGLIMLLVLLRQVVTQSENRQLTAILLSKATELERTNAELAVEITERERVEQKLSYDAMHDGLTELPNRILFLDRLGQAIEYSQRRREFSFAVLFIDMDHFKVVNDSLGHMMGDQLLTAIGARLRETIRSGDTLSRFGGDEFAILMDTLNQSDSADQLAARIQMALQAPFKLDEHEVHTSASIGIVTDVSGYRQAEDLLRDADLAMYEAKAQGKARFESFDVEMRNQAVRRLELEGELRKALESKGILVYYQPIVSLETGELAGFEALVRWKHPTRGLMLPRDFLAVAEDSNLILPLGEFIMLAACRQMKELQERYTGLRRITVSVNLSNRQFSQLGLTDGISRALYLSGLDPKSLRLEITERVLIGNIRMADHIFSELDRMGVEVEIDDFGTGYSALPYLQNYPIRALKIDKGFIQGMSNNKGLGLVRAIVWMAHELGMDTIAEGIETDQQLNQLKGLSCRYGQGFRLSPPLESEALLQLLDREARGETLWEPNF